MKRDLPSECSNCGIEERWLLHHVFIRNNHSRVCTSCVLKLHSGSFCPICFEVYEEGKLPENRVLCVRCPSVTHPNCVSKDVISSFVCPTCANPNFTFFESSSNGIGGVNNGSIDDHKCKILAAAAQIGYISMSKAAIGVKMEAERKVKEASLKRKEAKDALNRIHALFAEKKARGNVIVGKNPVPSMTMEEKKATKGNNPNNANNANNAIIATNNALSAAVAAQQRLERKSTVEPVMKSAVRVAVPTNNFGSVRTTMERPQTQNLNTVEKNKNSGYLPPLPNNVVSVEKEKNGIFTQSGKLQRLQIGGTDSEGQGSLKGCAGSGISRPLILPKKDSFVNSSNEGARLAPSNTTS